MAISTPPRELFDLACATARSHLLEPALVCAVVEQESGWDRWASRYEPAFYTRYIEPLLAGPAHLSPTEARARAFSWGLMQVMGQVAREHSFSGNSLVQLCEPVTGIAVGCRVLSAKLSSSAGDVTRALQLWNGGGNPEYAGAVLARAHKYAPR